MNIESAEQASASAMKTFFLSMLLACIMCVSPAMAERAQEDGLSAWKSQSQATDIRVVREPDNSLDAEGDGSLAPWLIGLGLAAIAMVLLVRMQRSHVD